MPIDHRPPGAASGKGDFLTTRSAKEQGQVEPRQPSTSRPERLERVAEKWELVFRIERAQIVESKARCDQAIPPDRIVL
jgi:hypothetical protein